MLNTSPSSSQHATYVAPEDRLGCVLAGRLELVSILGIGAYGVVYQAVDVFTNVPYAIKALPKSGLDPRQQPFQRREIALHHQASHHPNVVSLIRIVDSPDCTFMVMEYCPEGDLFSNITEQGRFVGVDHLAKHAFLQILDAVQYCHSIGIYHRDLKPENILVTNHGQTMKLADFGLATTYNNTADFGCGSTFYMSPECQQPSCAAHEQYASAPNDVWSLGVILVNLTCGRNPWKKASVEDTTFRAFLKDANFLGTILPVSPELNLMLRRVFECDPRKRISLQELRELIVACPRLTVSPCTEYPPSPPQSVYEYADSAECVNEALPPSPPATPPPASAEQSMGCEWVSFEPTHKRDSSCSSSGDSGYDSDPTYQDSVPSAPPSAFNFYGNVIPYYDIEKYNYQTSSNGPVVATF